MIFGSYRMSYERRKHDTHFPKHFFQLRSPHPLLTEIFPSVSIDLLQFHQHLNWSCYKQLLVNCVAFFLALMNTLMHARCK